MAQAPYSISDLPDEILSIIVLYLKTTDIAAFSQTCSYFYFFAQDQWCWKLLFERDFGATNNWKKLYRERHIQQVHNARRLARLQRQVLLREQEVQDYQKQVEIIERRNRSARPNNMVSNRMDTAPRDNVMGGYIGGRL